MSLSGQGDQKKFNNPNLMSKTVQKGPRSEINARKQAALGDVKVEAELGDKISNAEQKSTVSKSEKLGVPLLGNHFSGSIGDIPIKKRRLLFPSQEPSSMNQEESLSNSNAMTCENRSNTRLDGDGEVRSNSLEPTTKEFFGSENFSGVENLDTVTCSGGNYKIADHVKSARTTETKHLLIAGMKEAITSPESEGSSVLENARPIVHCGKMNASEDKSFGSLKNAKFHWDLNKMTDEWEEPGLNRPPDTEISSTKSDMINFFIPLASRTSSLAGQNAVIGYSRGQSVDQSFSEDTTKNYFPETADSQKLVPMYHGKPVTEEADHDGIHSQKGHDDDKFLSADPQSDICGSEVFQGERKLLADGNIMIKVEEGDESPYEEGELRETTVHAGDEKEDGDTENDRVDSELSHSLPKKFELGHGDSLTRQETSLLVEKSVDAVSENDVELHDKVAVSGHNQSDPKTFDGNMLPSFSGLHRSGTGYLKRSRFDDAGELHFQTERERLPYQARGRNEIDSRWDDCTVGAWESRKSYGNRFDDYDNSQSRSYDRRDMYRSPNRRQSPMERNESHGFRRGKEMVRGFSRGRSRGRSGFSSGELRRGPQERYYESRSHYVERRERAFSPTFSRGSHPRPHRRSRSRSRSLTPTEWNMRSRSLRPSGQDFRPEGRQQEERFPYQRSTSSGDFDQRFGSPPRGQHWSPKRSALVRHQEDRPYRDRRSPPPERMFRRNPRYDSVNYAERSKSPDDCFKPGTRPGRFSQMRGSSQGPRSYYESQDNRRKPGENYEAGRMRRYDTGSGGARLFRYDAEDRIEHYVVREVDRYFSRRDRASSMKEESGPPGPDEEKFPMFDAVECIEHSNVHKEDGCCIRRDTPSINEESGPPGPQEESGPPGTNEESGPPGTKEENFTNANSSSPREQEIDGNASTKEA